MASLILFSCDIPSVRGRTEFLRLYIGEYVHTYIYIYKYNVICTDTYRYLDVDDSLFYFDVFTVESRLVVRTHDNFIFYS